MKRLFPLAVATLVILMISLGFLMSGRGFPLHTNTSFATKVSLRYHYANKAIDTVITDKNDIKALKEMFAGPVWRDGGLSCGFDPDISITLSNGRKKIVFCPSCDTCFIIRIYGTNKSIELSDKQKKQFEAIVRKYGMTFPCE